MRPIRRLPQGGIQSLPFSVSPSLSPSRSQIPLRIKPHFVLRNNSNFYRNLKNNKCHFSMNLSVGWSFHMTVFQRSGKMPPLSIYSLIFTHITPPHCLLCSISPSLVSFPDLMYLIESFPPFSSPPWITPISILFESHAHAHSHTV